VEALVDDVVYGRPYFFAKLLNTKLKKIQNNNSNALNKLRAKATNSNDDAHKDVIRILLGRFEIDLAYIEYEFNQHFAKSWGWEVTTLLEVLSQKLHLTTKVSRYTEIITHLHRKHPLPNQKHGKVNGKIKI
jgi:hypothetical protein